MRNIGGYVVGLTSVLLMGCASIDAITRPADDLVMWSETPVSCHGSLRVQDGRIVDAQGRPFSVVGPSWFWSTTGWGQEGLYTADAVTWVAQDWQSGIVRAAISGHEGGGYVDDPTGNMVRAKALIDAAIASELYVIVDWHSHHAEDNVEEAKAFFTEIALTYGDAPNVIYEIYNEPLNTTDWDSVIKPYAEELVATIRAIDPDNLIVIGTQTWSQRLDKAVANPVSGTNLAYTLHFYAGGHKDDLRSLARDALDAGLPIMVTEWGGMNPSGDGDLDYRSMQAWTDLLREYGLSAASWAMSDKDESASVLLPKRSETGGWTQSDLTDWGAYLRDLNRAWPKACSKELG
jgi:aryl-phospho-beta-D-glucosidase BglC (GH1 family)